MKVEIKNASNVWVDITPYIAWQGLTFSRNDVDSPSAGRDMAGLMHRGRVAVKVRLDVTCRPLTGAEAAAVLNAVAPEFVTVRYEDPMQGSVTKTMYSNNIPALCATVYPDGTARWEGLSFPLIER